MSKRYLIPIVAFLVSLLIGWGLAGSQRRAIADVINTAGRNGWPILVTNHPMAKDCSLKLYTLNGESAGFSPRCRELALNPMYFMADGRFRAWRRGPGRDVEDFFEVVFPNVNGHSVPIPDRTPPFGFPTDRYKVACVGHRIIWWSASMIAIEDTESGELTVKNLGGNSPWAEREVVVPAAHFSISPEGILLIIAYNDLVDDGPQETWLYDLPVDNWRRVETSTGVSQSVIGAGGSVIGLSEWESPSDYSVVFLDGATLDALVTIDKGKHPVVGRRWAGCMKGEFLGDNTIVMFDMEDNWKRYEFALPNDLFLKVAGGLALYEPPPNGLAGMGDGYQSADIVE